MVKVKTSSERNAGTDANVTLTLHGASDSKPTALKSGSADLFERGTTDAFRLRLPDVGDLKGITLKHDGTGEPTATCLTLSLETMDVPVQTCSRVCYDVLDAVTRTSLSPNTSRLDTARPTHSSTCCF